MATIDASGYMYVNVLLCVSSGAFVSCYVYV